MRKPDPRRTKVIRRGDKVCIVTPDFFVRCGYPKSIESEAAIVLEKFGSIIRGMIRDPMKPDSYLDLYSDLSLVGKVCREVAYARLRVNGFGGTTRSIHSKRQDDLSGKEFVVADISFCKTGKYVAPSGGSSGPCGDEYEYDPGFLANEKTHKILSLSARSLCDGIGTGLRIDALNVEKVMPPDIPTEEEDDE